MKNKGVCKGCKYYIRKSSTPYFSGTCEYMVQTGTSRLMVELQNGGVKKDSCICYEAGRRKRRAISAID